MAEPKGELRKKPCVVEVVRGTMTREKATMLRCECSTRRWWPAAPVVVMMAQGSCGCGSGVPSNVSKYQWFMSKIRSPGPADPPKSSSPRCIHCSLPCWFVCCGAGVGNQCVQFCCCLFLESKGLGNVRSVVCLPLFTGNGSDGENIVTFLVYFMFQEVGYRKRV